MSISMTFHSFLSNYIPSASERMWYGEITGKICKISTNSTQINLMRMALTGDVRHMSLMGDQSPIEPLTAIGRHPFANVGCKFKHHKHSIFDISYLRLSNFCEHTKPPQSFFVDMGCASYDDSKAKPAGIFSSIPLFSRLYSKSCISFDKIFAWEARPYPNWWSKVPSDKRRRIVFNNFKVDANQVRFLLQGFTVSDFVVVKLDIDHLNTEFDIINVLNTYSHLIDELFFEYHYYFDGLDFGWGKISSMGSQQHNATSAIQLMRKFREKGVRAHFWI